MPSQTPAVCETMTVTLGTDRIGDGLSVLTYLGTYLGIQDRIAHMENILACGSMTNTMGIRSFHFCSILLISVASPDSPVPGPLLFFFSFPCRYVHTSYSVLSVLCVLYAFFFILIFYFLRRCLYLYMVILSNQTTVTCQTARLFQGHLLRALQHHHSPILPMSVSPISIRPVIQSPRESIA